MFVTAYQGVIALSLLIFLYSPGEIKAKKAA
jgi:hypothetical protein